ncbi:hypothetical protein L2E82_33817 [Cichorium intybus]|uniref:Uncharacterized protein n=1 Tax=Cichorium intybus TaxID=13427 RepID=A0ACB9BL56_CICIN|nr:hypothetical protein L2E82_33817 [Cichorium intybus]
MSKPQTRNPLQISSSKLTTETKGFSGRTCRRSLYIVFTAIALIFSTPAFILCIQFVILLSRLQQWRIHLQAKAKNFDFKLSASNYLTTCSIFFRFALFLKVSPLLIRASTDNNPTTRRKSLKSTISEAIQKFRNRIAKRKAFSAHKPLRIKRLKRGSYEKLSRPDCLMQACQYGHWEVVLTLILYKANIHKADYLNGGTALHMAALNGHSRCIRILLADYIPSVPNFLELVNKKSRIDEFVSELDEGSLYKTINRPADGGVTALYMATLNGHVDCLQLLIDFGASVDEVTVEDGTRIDLIGAGSTPLHYAACGGNAQCCQILIAKGASLTAENAKGWTPLAVAQSWHRDWLQEVLTEQSQDHEPIPPSSYLCLPLMKNVDGVTIPFPLCADPCAVYLENKCAVASEGCYIGKETGVRIATIEEEISLIHAKYQATTMKEFVQHSHSKFKGEVCSTSKSSSDSHDEVEQEETIDLHEAMEKAISGSEGSWSGSSSHYVSALQKALATQAHFVDVEIARTSLKIGEKIASGSSGDLYAAATLQIGIAVSRNPQRPIHQSKTVQHSQLHRRTTFIYEDDGTMNNAGGVIPVVLADPRKLCCPICSRPLYSPIYQEKRKCPSCFLPIGFIRCEAMEKLIESLRVECKNKRFGCKTTLIYHKKSEHEKRCPNKACYCPISSCIFASSSKNLYTHFSNHHFSTSFTYDTVFLIGVQRSWTHLILQERNEGVIFILNHAIQGHVRVFSVDCIGPSTFDNAFVYQLTAKYKKTVLSLESTPEVWSKWRQHAPDDNCLIIPSGFSEFFLQVCIKKAGPVV